VTALLRRVREPGRDPSGFNVALYQPSHIASVKQAAWDEWQDYFDHTLSSCYGREWIAFEKVGEPRPLPAAHELRDHPEYPSSPIALPGRSLLHPLRGH
jgi:hypothetical protein